MAEDTGRVVSRIEVWKALAAGVVIGWALAHAFPTGGVGGPAAPGAVHDAMDKRQEAG